MENEMPTTDETGTRLHPAEPQQHTCETATQHKVQKVKPTRLTLGREAVDREAAFKDMGGLRPL